MVLSLLTVKVTIHGSCESLNVDRPKSCRLAFRCATAMKIQVLSTGVSILTDLVDPCPFDAQPRFSTSASTVRRGIRTRIRVPCDGSD
jgi:hypothetical protein